MFTVKSLPQIGYKFFFYIHYGKEIDLKEEYGNNPTKHRNSKPIEIMKTEQNRELEFGGFPIYICNILKYSVTKLVMHVDLIAPHQMVDVCAAM